MRPSRASRVPDRGVGSDSSAGDQARTPSNPHGRRPPRRDLLRAEVPEVFLARPRPSSRAGQGRPTSLWTAGTSTGRTAPSMGVGVDDPVLGQQRTAPCFLQTHAACRRHTMTLVPSDHYDDQLSILLITKIGNVCGRRRRSRQSVSSPRMRWWRPFIRSPGRPATRPCTCHGRLLSTQSRPKVNVLRDKRISVTAAFRQPRGVR